ncbi:MAG: MATE family efflux transporter [Bacilli bacterium]|jgi:putative MATE family efflux protein
MKSEIIHEHKFINIFWPLLVEVFLAVLVTLTDTLMLYGVSGEAVGAVGSAATYLNFVTVAFAIFSTGALAVFTQFVGAKRHYAAQHALKLSLFINFAIALLISLTFIFFSTPILELLMGDSTLIPLASQYLQIVGGSAIFFGLTPIIGNYMRSFGHDKSPMFASLFANVVNIVLNYLAIYVFGWGVVGVAVATAASHLVNLIGHIVLAFVFVPKLTECSLDLNTKVILKDIVKIGLPSAFETFIYFGAMAAVVTILNLYDPSGVQVTVRVTVEHIASIAYIPSAALAHANAIKTGFRCGRHAYDRCSAETQRIALWGLVVSVSIATLLALFGEPIINLFTTSEGLQGSELEEIVTLVKTCLWIQVGLEVGRSINLIVGDSLKVAGDSLFVGIIGFLSLTVVVGVGSYVFGYHLGLGVIGVFTMLALDEIIRGLLMLFRWNTRRWSRKTLI